MAEQNNNFVENQDNQFFREEAIRPIEETDYYRKNCRYIFGLTVVVTYLDFCSRNYPSSNEVQTTTEKLIDGECSLDSNKNLKELYSNMFLLLIFHIFVHFRAKDNMEVKDALNCFICLLIGVYGLWTIKNIILRFYIEKICYKLISINFFNWNLMLVLGIYPAFYFVVATVLIMILIPYIIYLMCKDY